jgi:hypothetical protein
VSKILDRLNKITDTLNSNTIATHAYQHFKKITPVDKGHAKRNTHLKGTQIEADYPYAEVLDKGRGFRDGQMRGSTQAPQGMSKPTIQEIRDFVYSKTGIRMR